MGRLDPRSPCGAPRWWAIRKLTCEEFRADRGSDRAMLNNVLVLNIVTNNKLSTYASLSYLSYTLYRLEHTAEMARVLFIFLNLVVIPDF